MRSFHHKTYIVYPFLIVIMMTILIFNIFSQQTPISESKVPCIDPSKPVVQKFYFNLNVMVSGKFVELNPAIGHDPANCLREIYTSDSSGRVYVQSVSDKPYKLADFLAVYDRFSGNYHISKVIIDGNIVNSFAAPLAPDQKIEIDFE